MSLKYPAVALALLTAALLGWAIGDFRAFIHFFGIDTQQSDNYDFVSGFGPMLITLLLGSGVFATVWTHLNCHVDRCPGVGRFPVAGGAYKVCRKHHREVTGQHHGRLSVTHLAGLHRVHLNGDNPPGSTT